MKNMSLRRRKLIKEIRRKENIRNVRTTFSEFYLCYICRAVTNLNIIQ